MYKLVELLYSTPETNMVLVYTYTLYLQKREKKAETFSFSMDSSEQKRSTQ